MTKMTAESIFNIIFLHSQKAYDLVPLQAALCVYGIPFVLNVDPRLTLTYLSQGQISIRLMHYLRKKNAGSFFSKLLNQQ